MCGIAGIFMRGGEAAEALVLDKLEAALRHRGPDSSGRYLDGPIGLLNTRLAIIDVAGGDQPLYGTKGAVLVANGEVYNAPQLRDAMPGEPFATQSDCEPAAHLYEHHGVGYAEHLRGMYALAIHDPAKGRLILSRDQFGIKPLYYVQTGSYFAFASEPQALIAAGLAHPVLDKKHRDELLELKFTVGRETIYSGVERVLPGETLVVENGQVVERLRLPTLPTPPARKVKADDALAQFEAVMTDSVLVHLQTEVPYGLFLSGGIDSSILLLLMQRLSTQPIKAITVGYAAPPGESASAEQKVDESWAAMALAERHGADCRRVEMTAQDFWRYAPRIAAAIDDPTADAAVLPTWMLGKAAREDGLTVTLCGEGADELFGGYRRYRRNVLSSLRLRPKPHKGVFDKTVAAEKIPDGWADALAVVEGAEKARWSSRMAALQAIDAAEWLPNDLLVKLDRCLMAHGIEGRTPFLDKEVAAFAVGLPNTLRAGRGVGKLLMRQWLAGADPAYPAFAKKKGFNTPVGRWIEDRSDDLSLLVAAQPGVRALMDTEEVEAIFGNAAKHSQPAWSLLFYALWHNARILGLPSDGDIEAVLSEAA